MLAQLLVMMVDPGAQDDPLAAAVARVEEVNAYRLTLRSQGRGDEEVIHYAFRQPGYIRMDMVTPYRGAVLIYRPDTGKVRLWPFGSPGRRAGVTMSPSNRLVHSAHGHRVDESDVGTLLRNVQALRQQGSVRLEADATLDGRPARHLLVEGDPARATGDVARYELWLDSERLFPLKVVSFGRLGEQRETVWLEDLVIDPDLPPELFSP